MEALEEALAEALAEALVEALVEAPTEDLVQEQRWRRPWHRLPPRPCLAAARRERACSAESCIASVPGIHSPPARSRRGWHGVRCSWRMSRA